MSEENKLKKPWSGKSKGMQNVLSSIFREAADNIKQSKCATCGSDKIEPSDFKSDLCRKEYSISGMCQKCQDSFFG